ncbi:hypothetical protein F4677DRAFT_465230 [Hypoxylon crocopeplum]|nr:hypothetical protein F4677DRAFT_465230 [Hypoxylon crocopeplum]
MPCGCNIITIRYACRHKEREHTHCWRHYYRRQSCLGIFVPSCEPQRVSHGRSPRVCEECHGYFSMTFGSHAAVEVSEYFLRYKKREGLHRTPIDPRTVPIKTYISSVDICSVGAWMCDGWNKPLRPISEPEEEPEVERIVPRDSRMHQLIDESAHRRRHQDPIQPPHAHIRPPPPVVHRDRLRERRPTHSDRRPKPANISVRKPNPQAQKPRTRSHSSESNTMPIIPARIYPLRAARAAQQYGLEPDDRLEVDPISVGRALTRTPHQPRALRSNQLPRDSHNRISASSLVKKFTKIADEMGYPELELDDRPSVPKLNRAPKIPHWRTDTPHPADGKVEHRRSRSEIAMPRSILRSSTPLRTSPATYARTVLSMNSQAGPSARIYSPSPSVVPVPPRRRAGVRKGRHYRERGVPPAAHLHEENSDEEKAGRPKAMLVSVSTPSPRFSHAVQSCFCSQDERDDEVCPSCRERRRLEQELNMKWI